ncbi:MAG TPA: CRISPR-associated endonuclease Cas3'' [Phycisphaerae bacterium]|nr:CRISPR-associated endonuclease Cas3'' [Phycisphaerae bacterium]
METIAHRTEDGREQRLGEHLTSVSESAGRFAADFNVKELGEITGLLHDVGKYTAEFQKYIRRLQNRSLQTFHAAAGAWQALALSAEHKNSPAFQLAAMAIQGHHSGLHKPTLFLYDKGWKSQAQNIFNRAVKGGWMCGKYDNAPSLGAWLDLTAKLSKAGCYEMQCRLECLTRLMFSALIDADRLDSAKFAEPEKFAMRGDFSNHEKILSELLAKLEAHMAKFRADTPINILRAEMLQDCESKASQPSGVFSLAMPTGGGKTLAAMAFAFRHALANHLHRIIVAIPYTSIIDQNAAIYADIFGEQNVLQHHCNLDPDRYNGDEDESQKLLAEELACENWDRPIIVTTNVQLLESLFAASPSRCRKIHNVARSVIIFDEAQTLPPAMLEPTLDMLKIFVKFAGTSLICCTATQPAWKTIRDDVVGDISLKGIDDISEIISQPEIWHKKLSRVKYHWPSDMTQTTTWEELASKIVEHPRCLVIVPFREHVRKLISLLPDGTIGLSALMTPVHRKKVLDDIKRNMADKNAVCRVIATSLVEAGVDLDFPVVFRAIGPLDSIAQAAGRCNREGLLENGGDVHIFIPPENHQKSTVIGRGTDTTVTLVNAFRNSGAEPDMSDPTIFQKYFEELFKISNVDKLAVQASRRELDFPETQKRYHIIDDGWSASIIIPQDAKAAAALAVITQHNSGQKFSSAAELRKARSTLQQYTVAVSKKIAGAWISAGRIASLYQAADFIDGPYYLNDVFLENGYDDLGLKLGEIPKMSTGKTII